MPTTDAQLESKHFKQVEQRVKSRIFFQIGFLVCLLMKQIYNHRSKIVHGGKLENKEKFCELDGEKYDVARVAVDFLRYSLLFMTEHQEFLDSKKFDEYIGNKLYNTANTN